MIQLRILIILFLRFLFDQLTERNQLIWLISYTNNEINIKKEYPNNFDNKNYKLVVENLSKINLDNSYKPNDNLLELFKEDRFLYHLLSKKIFF